MSRWLPVLAALVMTLACTMAVTQPAASEARQWWAGHIETVGPTGPVKLAVRLTLAQDPSGVWHASFDAAPGSLGSGVLAAECSDVRVKPQAISMSLPLGAAMVLHLDRTAPDGGDASGELRAEGMPALPAVLRRMTEAETGAIVPPRPQTPRPPFPYERTEVRVTNDTDGVTLVGTLTFPAGGGGREGGRHPAVVLISDGGQQDRDHEGAFHRPFLVLADHLARAGIATLRLDDRGVAPSGGVPIDATPALLAGDVRAAAAILREHAEIDPARIGLLALGEGTLPAAMAAPDTGVAWLVLVAPQGLPGGEVIALREQRRMEAEGEDPAFIAAQTAATQRLMSLLAGGGGHDEIGAAIREAMLTGIRSLRGEGVPPEDWQFEETISQQLHQYTAPAARGWIAADPREALRKVRMPVLLVAGQLDRAMPTGDTFPAAEAALREGGAAITAHRLPGLNHLLQPAVTGFADEISTIRTTIDPKALALITEWIRAQEPANR
jgi:uncharacterized protein